MNRMLTKKDIDTLKGLFVTKGEFLEFKDEMRQFRNDMLTSFDAVFKQFERRNQEDTMAVAEERRQNHKLDDLEQRIRRLELGRIDH